MNGESLTSLRRVEIFTYAGIIAWPISESGSVLSVYKNL